MRVGFASLTKGGRDTNFKSCILKNANSDNLANLIKHNLDSLNKIIDYNIKNNIKVFRIASDIIPFGSSPVNTLNWSKHFEEELLAIGSKIKAHNIRVSMHPGKYTVLNSINNQVVDNATLDLEYHNLFLDSLKVSKASKIILHIGGVYGDKEAAINRFIKNYRQLNQNIKDRLVIENDDVSYNILDVLRISKVVDIPVVYDNLHNEILNADNSKSDSYWIKMTSHTWKENDGPQKIHYSQQDVNKRPGAHSETINLEEFFNFVESLNYDVDIMLEVKDKNLSALKCINLLDNSEIKHLELEWSKYKYSVLEKSPQIYNAIRQLLKDKSAYPVKDFYRLIDQALALEEDIGYSVNALAHVWGYFRRNASDKEKLKFEKMIVDYRSGKIRMGLVKNFLEKLAIKYNEKYLLNSYYFDI